MVEIDHKEPVAADLDLKLARHSNYGPCSGGDADDQLHKHLPLFSHDYDADCPPVTRAFKDTLKKVDALLFVAPEYNRSIPGRLKHAIDRASRPYGANSFTHKPSAVIGARQGQSALLSPNKTLRF